MDTRNAAHTHMFQEPYEHRPSEVPAHSRTKMGLSQILQSASSRLGPEVSLGLECRRRDIVSVSSKAIRTCHVLYRRRAPGPHGLEGGVAT